MYPTKAWPVPGLVLRSPTLPLRSLRMVNRLEEEEDELGRGEDLGDGTSPSPGNIWRDS